MALMKNMTIKNNLSMDSLVQDCYIRVDSVSASKENCAARVSFVSNSKVLMQNIYEFNGSFDDQSQNIIRQAYEHLKTLPEFSGAADV